MNPGTLVSESLNEAYAIGPCVLSSWESINGFALCEQHFGRTWNESHHLSHWVGIQEPPFHSDVTWASPSALRSLSSHLEDGVTVSTSAACWEGLQQMRQVLGPVPDMGLRFKKCLLSSSSPSALPLTVLRAPEEFFPVAS